MTGASVGVDILPPRRRLRTALRAVGVCLVLLVAAGGWWVSAPFRGSASSQTAVGIHKVQGASWRPELGQPLFIAVLGSDERSGTPGGGGRCDAVHIVSINPVAKAGSIINIPRDTWVGSKINDRCVRGPEPMVEALKSLTGIPIQYYLTTEFSHFMRFIDELGGLTLNVPYGMNDAASGARFAPGPRHMFGGDVLAFSRNRKDTPRGDFSRSFNQGEIILAGLAKFRAEAAADPGRMLDYMRAAQRHTKFTVPLTDAVKLALLAREIDPANVRNIEPRGRTGSVGAASVVFLEPGDTFQRVKDDGVY